MKNPKVIDPPNFDVDRAWKGHCKDVDDAGGLVSDDGEVNWGAAFAADPGLCGCPRCHRSYWAFGKVQQCECGFVFPVHWWSDYSSGVNDGRTKAKSGLVSAKMKKRLENPYYREGFNNPPDGDAYKFAHTLDWKTIVGDWSPVGFEPFSAMRNCERCGVAKENPNRSGLCHKCESETCCVHRVSMMEKQCKAGVQFDSLKPNVASGECMPCYYVDGRKPCFCAKFEPKPLVMIQERHKAMDAARDRLMAVNPMVAKVKKEHKGENWRGVETCPICSGKLHLSHAKYNSHVHGVCETEGCVSWME